MVGIYRNKYRFRVSTDFDFDLQGDGLAVCAGGGQSVSSCFYWLYVNAETVRRPNGVRLRLQSNAFGVSDAKANLSCFAAGDPRRGVEHLDREFTAAELLDCGLIRLALLFGLRFFGAMLVGAIFLPPRKQHPTDINCDDENQGGGIGQRISEKTLLRRLILVRHHWAFVGLLLRLLKINGWRRFVNEKSLWQYGR